MKRILNYPGSKWTMANFIVNIMPNHVTYLEPFFGSGAVFFNKPKSPIETVNDIDSRVINFFKVCRNYPSELMQLLRMTPLSREEYYNSYEASDDSIEDARRMMIRSWQAIGGKTSDKTGWRANINLNGSKIKEWNNLDKRIVDVAKRLKDAQIEHQDAFKLIERYNRPNVLVYVDPPYLMETRNKRLYAHEFNEEDHISLLELLTNFKGKVILSGYDNDIYDSTLKNWDSTTFETTAETGVHRTEKLWCNFKIPAFACQEQLELLKV